MAFRVSDADPADESDGRAAEQASGSLRAAEPGDSAGHRNSMPPSIPICFGGEDWVTLSLYLRHRSFSELVERLDKHRLAAEHHHQGGDELTLADQQFLMLPLGAKASSKRSKAYFRWQLQSATRFTLQLMNRESCEGTMPNAKMVATSLVLMRLGVDEVVRQAFAALEALGADVVRNKVSRVDVCCDLPDRKVEPLKLAFDAEHYVSRGKMSDEHGALTEFRDSDMSVYRVGSEVTSFNLGRCDARMRVYEKVKECKHDIVKLQTLIDCRWGVFPYWAIRVEFQLRRAKLKALGVDSFADWMANRATIVHYLTHDWFRLTDGPVDHKHPDRTPTLPVWQEVQGGMASWTGGGHLLELGPIPSQPMPPDHYVKSIVGSLKSLFAKTGTVIDSNETFWHEAMWRIVDEIEDRNMAAEVARRILELGVAGVKGIGKGEPC